MPKEGRGSFSTISLPTPLVEEVKRVADELGYWPTKTDLIRQAVLEKMKRYKGSSSDSVEKRKFSEPEVGTNILARERA